MKKLSVFMAIVSFLLIQSFAAAEEAPLAKWVKDKQPVKAFVKGFVNESGQDQVSPEEFKKVFEESLLNRKAVRFEIVKDPGESTVRISGIIRKYRYLENDPINSFAGPSGLLLDAGTTENYVEMAVKFDLVDTRRNKALWSGMITAYVERRMTPEESLPIIYDKLSRTFLWKCFGKGK